MSVPDDSLHLTSLLGVSQALSAKDIRTSLPRVLEILVEDFGALNGAITLQANTITQSSCKVLSTTTAAAPTATPTATPSATPSAQVKVVPAGAVRTGDGSTSGNNNEQGLLAGALVLAGIGSATLVVRRRRGANL